LPVALRRLQEQHYFRLTVLSAVVLGIAGIGVASLSGGGRRPPVRPLREPRAVGVTSRHAVLIAPVAAGTSAGNIPLDSANHWVLLRWVARHSGTLSALHVRIQADGATCRQDRKHGYGAGTGGIWHVTTHPVLPDGRPDMNTTLAAQDVRPCMSPSSVVDVLQGEVRLPMNLAVHEGGEYATVFRNVDRRPATNYTSTNFLYSRQGIVGANGGNTRRANARNIYYGLDPRELVGYSVDAGLTWRLPGGPYGHPMGQNFLPTYVQEFSDGVTDGQPYYYATPSSTLPTRMVFTNIPVPWTIRALGAYATAPASGVLELRLDGTIVRRVRVAGSGMLRGSVAVVTVNPGQVVEVVSSGRVPIAPVVADTKWGHLVGLDRPSRRWYLAGASNFSEAAPLYALPMYPAPGDRRLAG
jgi:hypothetical protein